MNNITKSIKIIIVIIPLFITSVSAQYFGRNKVQYEDFDFKIYQTEDFDIYHYPSEQEAVKDAAVMLEKWNSRFSRIFNIKVTDQPIILYANHPDFQQTNAISGMIPQGTGGVTEGFINRVVIPLTGVYKENDHVLGHELVHAYQYRTIKSKEGGLRSASRLPLWFVEGMAEYLTIGSKDPLTAMWMRDAVLNEDVPTFQEVSRSPEYFPYRYGHAMWNVIASHWGDRSVNILLNAVLDSGYVAGIENTLGVGMDSLSTLWQESIRQTYSPRLENLVNPSDVGDSLIGGENTINLAPVVSPDGKTVALFSQQELFTLDLYLIDTETGEVIKQLASSATDEHFDALRFMNSAGSWSPGGERFAFVTIDNGDNKISIVDVESGDITGPIALDNVDGITGLSWSPGGNKILLSGTSGGIGNLYLYDLRDNSYKQLTADKYAQIQPDWSSDGRKIAFVTDKGKFTDMNNLRFGKMQIEIKNIETGNTEFVSISGNAKHINPQFSPEGNELFFIADPDGISNIYRYSFEKDTFYKLTNIATGITGLTELSPAMSMAENQRKIIFTAFDKSSYIVRSLEGDELNGEPFTPDDSNYETTVSLPPVARTEEGIVSNYLTIDDPTSVRLGDIKLSDYDPSLQLLTAGYTSIGIGVSRFGAGLGGATNLIWTDMLGNHLLSVTAQVNGGIKDLGAQAVYMNRGNRLNYGAAIGHIPYTTGGISRGLDTVTIDGDRYLAQETTLISQRVFSDRASLLLEYPLSQNRRFEFSAGFNRISYDIETRTFTQLGNVIINVEEGDLEAPDGLNLVNASAAYVGDYSFFGFTSPIDGSRYRFEAEPTVGSLDYITFLTDYRQYLFAEPVTFAFRALHYGRYFGDSENERLSPLQVGFNTLVRGYDINSFSNSEFAGRGDFFAQYNRLLGSKIGVFNFEIRLPLFGNDRFGLINFPLLPTEISLFGDAGVAWTRNDPPVITFDTDSDERVPVFSAGIAARFNLFGYLIGQVYYAVPFQRPNTDGLFGFVIAPGW